MGEDEESWKEIEELVPFTPIWDAKQNQRSAVLSASFVVALQRAELASRSDLFPPTTVYFIHL